MVSSCGCNSTQATQTTAGTYDASASSDTGFIECDCNKHMVLTAIAAAEPEPEEIKKLPFKWELIRTILYAILILRQYVAPVARAPPLISAAYV